LLYETAKSLFWNWSSKRVLIKNVFAEEIRFFKNIFIEVVFISKKNVFLHPEFQASKK